MSRTHTKSDSCIGQLFAETHLGVPRTLKRSGSLRTQVLKTQEGVSWVVWLAENALLSIADPTGFRSRLATRVHQLPSKNR